MVNLTNQYLPGILVALLVICILLLFYKLELFKFSPRYAWEDIIENMEDGILIMDFNHAIRFANKEISLMLEYPHEELKKKDILLLLADEESVKRFLLNINRRKMGLSDKYVLQAKTKTGTLITCKINASPYYNKKGKIIGSVAIVQNISEIVRLEKALELKIKDLNHFIYKTHHDLRAPLTSVLGLCNIYEMDVTDENALKYISMIRGSVLKLDAVLRDLQRISILTNNLLMPSQFGLYSEIEIIKDSLKKLDYFPYIILKQEIDFYETITTDRDVFRAIIQNLLTNSINYLDLKKEKSIVLIQIKRIANAIEITISDNGIGICKEYHSKIWDIFFRANDTIPGRGIGLYIVKVALERLNGSIHLFSEKGKGTRFVLMIPDMTKAI